MNKKSQLQLKYVTAKTASECCRRWHYSRSMPAGKSVKVGIWEDNEFVGVIIFSRGANRHIGSPYGLKQDQICELTRVAMKSHTTPVSQCIAYALKMLKKAAPGLKMVISYADKDQGHSGGIYKAGNWIYEGLVNEGTRAKMLIHGKEMHPKSVHSKLAKRYPGKPVQSLQWLKENIDPNAQLLTTKGKHKYLMPLDKKTRKGIMKLAKPYEK